MSSSLPDKSRISATDNLMQVLDWMMTLPCSLLHPALLSQPPCFTAILGSPSALDMRRRGYIVHTPDSLSCGVGSRLEFVFRLQPIPTKGLAPIPGPANFLMVGEEAENMVHGRDTAGSMRFMFSLLAPVSGNWLIRESSPIWLAWAGGETPILTESLPHS